MRQLEKRGIVMIKKKKIKKNKRKTVIDGVGDLTNII